MSERNTYVIILAGGVGKRFHPYSTQEKPKPFLHITSEQRTMIQQTYDRVSAFCSPDHIYVSTSQRHRKLVRRQLPEIPKFNVILEPHKKKTAPAIALITYLIHRRDPDAVLLFVPSDHFIAEPVVAVDIWRKSLARAAEEPVLMTYGAGAMIPSSEYGYIQSGDHIEGTDALVVKQFVEKPDVETATKYLKSGDYFWNAGMYAWKAQTFIDEFETLQPEMATQLSRMTFAPDGTLSSSWLERFFTEAEEISIDYAIMEKAHNVNVVPFHCGWSDVSSWERLAELATRFSIVLPAVVQDYAAQKFCTPETRGLFDLICVGKPPSETEPLTINENLLDYHRFRFKRHAIPMADDAARAVPRARSECVLIADPLGQLPQSYVLELLKAGREVVLIDQRYVGKEYLERMEARPLWHINVWPRGYLLAENEVRIDKAMSEVEMLPWISTMAEEAVAVGYLSGCHSVIGVGRCGGLIAAEVATRLGLGMVYYLKEVAEVLEDDVRVRDRAGVLCDLMELWSESSSFRTANEIVTRRSSLSPEEMRTLMQYDAIKAEHLEIPVDESELIDSIDVLAAQPKGKVGEAFHRATHLWRGDLPVVDEGHRKAAMLLKPYLEKWSIEAALRGKRLTVSFGGESGCGKTEIACYLQLLLYAEACQSALIPGDAFFKRPPSENMAERVYLSRRSQDQLKRFLTSQEEIDYAGVDEVINYAKDRARDRVLIPSDARRIDVIPDEHGRLVRRSRRYARVPVFLQDVDIIFLDLTISPVLEHVDVKVFYEHTYRQKLARIRRRNAQRDPNQDFEFISSVLKIEHDKIAPLADRAHVLVDVDYNVRVVREPF